LVDQHHNFQNTIPKKNLIKDRTHLQQAVTRANGIEGDPLSTRLCAVCNHYECYHDEQGCFLDRDGRRSRDPGLLDRRASKNTGTECWCPEFTPNFLQAADLIYRLGDSDALKQGTVEAVNREDFGNAQRLLDRYVTKTPSEARDVTWIGAVGRRIAPESGKADTADANRWRIFRDDFTYLTEEELRLAPNNKDDRWLRAYALFEDPSAPLGDWHLSEGLNEGFQARFETVAARAGVVLGSGRRTKPQDYWLHQLFLDLKARKSKLLFADGIILRVCEASATYCARLEKEAVEKSAREFGPKVRERDAKVSPISKLADAAKFPTMTVQDVMDLLHISRATIYRYLNEGRLDRPGLNKRPGKRSKTLVLTTSVQRMLQPIQE
jgi:hypothetical protein